MIRKDVWKNDEHYYCCHLGVLYCYGFFFGVGGVVYVIVLGKVLTVEGV